MILKKATNDIRIFLDATSFRKSNQNLVKDNKLKAWESTILIQLPIENYQNRERCIESRK